MSYNLVIKTTFTDTTNCCGGGVSCYLTLPPPIGASPYPDLATATSTIATYVASCVGFSDGTGTLNSFTATKGTNTITMVADGNPTGALNPSFKGWYAAKFSGSATLTYNFSLASGPILSARIDVVDNTGTTVNTTSGSSSPLTVSVPSAGTYEIQVILVSLNMGTDTFTCTVSSDSTETFCGVRAAYGATPNYVICT